MKQLKHITSGNRSYWINSDHVTHIEEVANDNLVVHLSNGKSFNIPKHGNPFIENIQIRGE